MPQEHYVLKCFSCDIFQVQIVKKAKKWECKMCGAKQSVKRTYGRGSGKDCRNQVMKLNELHLRNDYSTIEAEKQIIDNDCTLSEVKQESEPNTQLTSKWGKYFDEPIEEVESKVEDCIRDIYSKSEEKNKKRVKKTEDHSSKNKKICMDPDTNTISSPVMSLLFSPPGGMKNIESSKIEKAAEINSSVQTQNKVKSSKYAKYLEDDDDGENIENKKEKDVIPNIFDSGPNDLDNILSLE